MTSKSRSEGSFLGFLGSKGIAPKALIVLLAGVLLVVLGNLDFPSRKAATEEEKIAELCSMTEGVGECRVMVTYSSDGETVFAVAVLCDGAESAFVREKITASICSLYGIGAHRVSVMKLRE